jgi:hypothetical protein
MYCRATSLIAAGIWATALSAQTPAAAPQARHVEEFLHVPVIRPETERTLRELVQKLSQGETAVCSIPLRELPIAKNVERMPTIRPNENIDHMPMAKLPAPPCQEENR